MSGIIRVEKNKNYSVINNTGLKDSSLSWGAKGLLTYLLSLPNDWQIKAEHLKKVSVDGRDSTSSKIKELIKQGYITRSEKMKIKNGRWTGYDYTVYEKPLRKTRNGKTVTENPEVINTNIPSINKQNTNNIKDNTSSKEEVKKHLKRNIVLFNKYENILHKIRNTGTFNFRLPEYGVIPSKRIQQTCIYMQDILSGQFVNMDFNSNKYMDSFKQLRKLELKTLFRVIKRALDNFEKLQTPGYWPVDKSMLTKNISEFFYNPRTKKSWFLYCLSNKCEPLETEAYKTVMNSIKSQESVNIAKSFKKKSWDNLIFWRKIKQIEKWHNANLEKLTIYHKIFVNKSYSSYMGLFSQVMSNYKNFLCEWKSLSLGNIGYGNKTWDKFIDYMEAKFDFELEPDEKDIVSAYKLDDEASEIEKGSTKDYDIYSEQPIAHGAIV